MNQHALPSAAAYDLNDGQSAAADAFMAFLFNPEAKEFIISGPAGVGKTYLMSAMIDVIMPRYFEMCQLMGEKPKYREVVMTATTNKAAEVLGKATNRPTSTIHSFFALTVWDDFATGKSMLKKTNRWQIQYSKIIFVDECSMIDAGLWTVINEGTVDCKIVYVGDKSQLAPVHEDVSPIYKQRLQMVELTQPVRNAGQPALMNVCQQLRDTVETGIFWPIQTVPGIIDLLDGAEMQAKIDEYFREQTQSSRILAYTNKRVIEYNDHIRGLRQLPAARFTKGEFLVSASVIHTRKGNIPVEMEVEVLENHGPTRLLISEEHLETGLEEVWLDVDSLVLRNEFGEIFTDVPVMTNREHFEALVKYYTSTKNWKAKFNLKNNIADLRPRDAATVHKSQGSTYDTVFIDLGNISTCHQPNSAARMLYVAFSRARSRVFLYGDLAHKYGGLILP